MTADIAADLAPTGTLRASINLGNPVLAQGTPHNPAGVTVDIAREVAARLGVPVELVCFAAARESLAALTSGRADIGFLAIEPARAADITFTAPYAIIEGIFAVPGDSPLTSVAAVDAPGVRIGVKEGSAYDLYLTRTLRNATVVRGADGTTAFLDGGLEVAAGIREPLTEFVAARPGLRLLDGAFMQIRQAVAVANGKRPGTVAFLASLIEELKASGFFSSRGVHTNPPDPPASTGHCP
jgi:polar amino acid transport system substrate-binding protein